MPYTGKFQVFEDIIKEIMIVYKHDSRPWLIGYSGGKDSTLLVCLVYEAIKRLKDAGAKLDKTVHVITSDTMVENPIVKNYMHSSSDSINRAAGKDRLNIKASVIYPEPEQTFWSRVIGLGYPTPEPPGFRWCTDRLKIMPMNKFVNERIKESGEIIILLGVRKGESLTRMKTITAREIEGKLLNMHNDIPNAYVYNPITEIPNDLVWEFLLKDDCRSPWGSDMKYLFSLYQGENLGEEKSVLGEVDREKIPVTGNSRFGCWCCTMVKEDKSLQNFINKGATELIPLREFRNELLRMRENSQYRDSKRRNGSVYKKSDGSFGMGPFTLEARCLILEKLLDLENRTGMELITEAELKAIDKMWDEEEINREPITVQKLVLSKADKQYFEDLIEARECTERRDSHRRINRAFKKLEKFVAGIIDAETTVDAKIDALAKIENIVHNNCTIIFIDSKTRESAYKLFQVLNDRGAGLTEGDLLKSKTLEVLEKHFSIKQSTVQDAWDEILQDEPKQIEQFLRYYYASVCGSRVGRTSLYDDFLKQFFPDIVDVDDVSDEATATKIVDTVNQILREIRTYRKLIAGIWPYEVGQPLTDWDRKRLDILIRFLDFDIVYPLLLAAVQLKQKTFADLVHMLEKFMFRHKSVCNLGHQKLSELYMQEAVKIRRDPENYRLTDLRTTLKEYIETECTDAVFKVGLSNLKYRTNGGNKPLRYLFSTLNEHIEWYRNGAVGAPAPQKGTVINYDNVTIEHIASQSPSAAVPGFTSENIHTLSNLTLLTNGENDRAKNKAYTAKKAIYHDSEYIINKYFDGVDDWSVESAKAWEQYLQEMVCKVFVV